jgi:hypothetical protein
MAAHAAVIEGHEVDIISKRRKSEMFGAQYLHKPIPSLPEVSSGIVLYRLEDGTHEEYRLKVYGHEFGGQVSTQQFGEPHDAWDIRATYNSLWDLYFERIKSAEWDRSNSHVLTEQIVVNYDMVISSLPRPVLCFNPQHQFASKKIWAVGDAPERGVFVPFRVENMNVICSASPEVGWYRASNIFGYGTVEWALRKKPPVAGVSVVVKPLATDCDCWPMIRHVGRYGKWKKGVLSHTAYFDTLDYVVKGVFIQ